VEGVAHFVDPLARELVLFAAAMLLIGGIDDLAVDLLYWWRRIRRGPDVPFKLSPRRVAGRMAVFVPAWHEADVIGRMLDAALSAEEKAKLMFEVEGTGIKRGSFSARSAGILSSLKALGEPSSL
jgi:hypothetical protein